MQNLDPPGKKRSQNNGLETQRWNKKGFTDIYCFGLAPCAKFK